MRRKIPISTLLIPCLLLTAVNRTGGQMQFGKASLRHYVLQSMSNNEVKPTTNPSLHVPLPRNLPTTGRAVAPAPRFGPVIGLTEAPIKERIGQSSNIFNYKYGYINPYYPFPADTPIIRPGANDYHEGWVSKYLYTRPTVSPYMGLFRHDFTPYGSTRYHTFVRPRIEEFYQLTRTQAAKHNLSVARY